MYFAYNFAKGK